MRFSWLRAVGHDPCPDHGIMAQPVQPAEFDHVIRDQMGGYRLAVGGPDDIQGESEEADNDCEDGTAPPAIDKAGEVYQPDERAHTNVEPLCYHGVPKEFFESVIHKFRLRCVVDATVGDGELALACFNRQCDYVGICHNFKHTEVIYAAVEAWLLTEFGKQGSQNYQPGFVKAKAKMQKAGAEKEESKNGKKGGEEPKGKAKAKAKAGRKKKDK